MIPQELVDRVRDEADIVQIIGEHVKLKRQGTDFRGPCPFHGGKNPNFSVSPRRAMYHCFKCGESGNVFTFLQKHLGITFPDAVRSVAATEGIEIPDSPVQRAGPDPREPYWESNATAAEYFTDFLWNDPSGEEAQAYLARRGVTREIADRFGFGLAPRDAVSFRETMGKLGFSDARLIESGLMVAPEGKREARPRFRSRLMIPIFDAQGHPVGFGGRTLGELEPKYLNSPETAAFHKGKTLYALNWTRNDIRKEDRVFVVEGYFDAIRLMIAGINTVVAPLGTALTDAQAALLSRHTKNVYLLYDSDQAGLKATFRAGDELLRAGMSVRVITLPDGDDPDTFVARHGAAGLEAQVNQSVDVFERKLQLLLRGGWFNELQKKRRALDRLFPTIRATSDVLLRDLYLTRTSELTGIAKAVLEREVEESIQRERSRGGGHAGHAGHAARVVRGGPDFDAEVEEVGLPPFGQEAELGAHPDAMHTQKAPARRREHRRARRSGSSERELVRAMLGDPHRVEAIAERIGPDRFQDSRYQAIFEAMLALGDEFDLEKLVDHLDDAESIAVVNELLAEPDLQQDPAATIAASISDLQLRDLGDELAGIDRMLSVATEDEQKNFMQRKQELQKEAETSGQAVVKWQKLWGMGRSGPRS